MLDLMAQRRLAEAAIAAWRHRLCLEYDREEVSELDEAPAVFSVASLVADLIHLCDFEEVSWQSVLKDAERLVDFERSHGYINTPFEARAPQRRSV